MVADSLLVDLFVMLTFLFGFYCVLIAVLFNLAVGCGGEFWLQLVTFAFCLRCWWLVVYVGVGY